VSELASEPVSQRFAKRPTERSEGVRVSELASEPVSQRFAKRPTERSEEVR
jgi:hypothetical protein